MSTIAEHLSHIVVGDPVQFHNLTLYPLLADESAEEPADGSAEPGYRLLDAALADGTARITEVSAAGHVPELSFSNRGDLPVLLLDGEELIGAKQNRILNLTVLAPAHKTIVIPVSCVEAGRWHANSAEFGGAGRAHFAKGRARKAADVSRSLRARGSRESDQGAVWNDIAERASRMQVDSATGAAAALYDQHRERLDAFRHAFVPHPRQCGALFAINGRLIGLDLFDSPKTFAAALGKLVESHALDAIDTANASAPATSAHAGAEAARHWLTAIGQAEVERFAAVGEGEDWRIYGDTVSGGALIKDGHLIHLCAFHVAADGDDDTSADPDGQARPRLALATDRRLIRYRGLSKRYVHLQLQAPHASIARSPLDVALVLDRSGSMGGDKWPRAREAALALIDRLGPGDRVALVVFDEQVDTLLRLTPAGAEARQTAAAALAHVGPRGGTDLGKGWLTGCGLIGRDGEDERLHRCLLLTDGQANRGITDASEFAQHAGALRELGVVTSTFGVGDDYDEALLGTLADAGGGSFYDIASAAGIPNAIGAELGDALAVVCAEPRLRLSWRGELQVEALGPWRVEAEASALTLHPGDLVSNQVLDLLVSVAFPPGEQHAEQALQVQLSDGNRILVEDSIRWTYVNSATRKAQPRDTAVERRVAEHQANQARLEAVAANRAGDLKQAREVLRAAARRIRKYVGDNAELLPLADDLEAEVERHSERHSARQIKQAIHEARSAVGGREQDGRRKRRAQPSQPPQLQYRPCLDSPELAERCHQLRKLPRAQCQRWGQETLAAIDTGGYTNALGARVDWQAAVANARATKHSLPSDAPLPPAGPLRYPSTPVQVVNAMTLAVARRLAEVHQRVLVLNFANGIEPGGGFLQGNRAQESVLCRSSALYATLQDDPMYAAHAKRPRPDSTDWAILSPDVPIYRDDDGVPLEQPWTVSVLTCAAPYAPTLGVEVAADLMRSRIRRILAIARSAGYPALVLGAWGCGTYGNDPKRIAALFHAALKEQAGAFAEVVFAIADWSTERAFLGPFSAEFEAGPEAVSDTATQQAE